MSRASTPPAMALAAWPARISVAASRMLYAPPAHAALAENQAADTESPAKGVVMELRELNLLAPFVVKDQPRELRVQLERSNVGWELQISSDGELHAQGELRATQCTAPAPVSLAEIEARCSRDVEPREDAHMDFGPRWQNRRSVRYGSGEALLTLALPDAVAGDCHTASIMCWLAGGRAGCVSKA